MFAEAPQECAERGQTIGEASEPEELLLQGVGQARRSPWRAAGGAAAGLLLLAGAGAGAAHLSLRGAASGADRLQSKEQTIAFPSREQCSNWDEVTPGFTPGTMSQILCVQVTQIAPLQGWPAWEKQAGLVASFGGATSRCQTHRERHRE